MNGRYKGSSKIQKISVVLGAVALEYIMKIMTLSFVWSAIFGWRVSAVVKIANFVVNDLTSPFHQLKTN